MKNQSGSLGFLIQGKISVYMFYALSIVYFLFLRIRLRVISVQG